METASREISVTTAATKACSLNNWWRIADGLVFGLWVALIGIVLPRHEPWADEAQAWLLARDLDLKTLWFHELRYEGTPGLWHTLLWIAQHWFHAPYAGLGVVGMLCAAAGVAFTLWKCPFPRPLSYLLVFSYFIAYQYAIVARSYNLLPLLLFTAAEFYRDRTHPVRMTVALALLANVAMHGTLLAAVLGVCYLVEASQDWSRLTVAVRSRYLYCLVAMLCVFVFLFVILRPTSDVAELVNYPTTEPTSNELKLGVATVIEQAFLDKVTISVLFLAVASVWCFTRRSLLTFVLPVALMVALFIALGGRCHHIGLVFLAAMAGLWIAWPSQTELRELPPGRRFTTFGMAALLALLLCINIWDTAVTIKKDYLFPYTGAADAAHYLKQMAAEETSIFGYNYGMSALQAYFDHNILANIPTTYYHKGLPLRGAVVDFEELKHAAPEYVIVFVDEETALKPDESRLRAIGYDLVHLSRARLFFKGIDLFRQDYYIWRRGTRK